MKTIYKISLAVVSILIFGGIVLGLYMFNLKPKDLQKVKPDYYLSASELLNAFENDEKAATSQYVGKVLEVSGIILEIKPGENSSLSISLDAGNDISSVICTLQDNKDSAKFSKGWHVTLRGECSGFLMDVLLNNCVVVFDPK